MISFPKKRFFALVGAPRVGKDEVARFLNETRGFQVMAFADQIKEEFGISKEEFEAAKIAGNIAELRQKLWDFSDKIKQTDPFYFINKVLDKVNCADGSVVISDLRTTEELERFYCSAGARIYYVTGKVEDAGETLADSKIPIALIRDCLIGNLARDMRTISNKADGLYSFYQDLDKFFFLEDVKDLLHIGNEQDIIEYLKQYNVQQIRKG